MAVSIDWAMRGKRLEAVFICVDQAFPASICLQVPGTRKQVALTDVHVVIVSARLLGA